MNAYRDTKQHRGYQILKSWKERVVARRAVKESWAKTFEQLSHSGSLSSGVRLDTITNDPFFIYTSNVRAPLTSTHSHIESIYSCRARGQVDSHFHRDFEPNEVYELHGNVETWQCGAKAPCNIIWSMPTDTRLTIDSTTMRAAEDELPRCPKCDGKARPNVLMFHDTAWIANRSDEDRYVAWEAVMEEVRRFLAVDRDPDWSSALCA